MSHSFRGRFKETCNVPVLKNYVVLSAQHGLDKVGGEGGRYAWSLYYSVTFCIEMNYNKLITFKITMLRRQG